MKFSIGVFAALALSACTGQIGEGSSDTHLGFNEDMCCNDSTTAIVDCETGGASYTHQCNAGCWDGPNVDAPTCATQCSDGAIRDADGKVLLECGAGKECNSSGAAVCSEVYRCTGNPNGPATVVNEATGATYRCPDDRPLCKSATFAGALGYYMDVICKQDPNGNCADGDDDGVCDGVDGCPDEAGPGTSTGCPPVDEDQCFDDDNDGVCYADDECPEDKASGSQNNNSDGDKLCNVHDSCPTQPSSEADGCPVSGGGGGGGGGGSGYDPNCPSAGTNNADSCTGDSQRCANTPTWGPVMQACRPGGASCSTERCWQVVGTSPCSC